MGKEKIKRKKRRNEKKDEGEGEKTEGKDDPQRKKDSEKVTPIFIFKKVSNWHIGCEALLQRKKNNKEEDKRVEGIFTHIETFYNY